MIWTNTKNYRSTSNGSTFGGEVEDFYNSEYITFEVYAGSGTTNKNKVAVTKQTLNNFACKKSSSGLNMSFLYQM